MHADGQRRVDEQAGAMSTKIVVLRPGFGFTALCWRGDPGREVKHSLATSELSQDCLLVEEIKSSVRWGLDLVAGVCENRKERPPEYATAAYHKDQHGDKARICGVWRRVHWRDGTGRTATRLVTGRRGRPRDGRPRASADN